MNIHLFLPELALLAGCLAAFCMTIGKAGKNAMRVSILCAALAYTLAAIWTLPLKGSLFYDAYRVDLFSQMVKCAMGLGFCLMLFFGGEVKGIDDDVKAEYYLFLLTALLGLTLLVSSVELVTLFIALELSSYSLYLLVPMRSATDGQTWHVEAAVKYLFFGVASSGIMLFGISWIFGLTGTTYMSGILPVLHTVSSQPVGVMALVMLLCGMFFKLAVFPFHFWTPDVYQGASNETTAFISSLPKVAAVAVLARFCALAAPDSIALPTLLTVLSVCSMFYGNLTALVQKDVKRMLGFSGIAHAGYILLGMVTLKAWGFGTALYYGIGYLFMMLAAFLVLYTVAPNGGNVNVKNLNGLSRRSPLLAFIMTVSMFALAGIPPFAGFMGKFMLLTSAFKSGYVLLVVIAAINTAIGIYYYLQVVRAVYAEDENETAEVPVTTAGTRVAGVCLVAITLALGIMPETVVDMAVKAMQAAW